MLFYPVNKQLEYIKNGGTDLAPHHFWGYDELEKSNHQVEILEFQEDSLLGRIGKKLHIPNLPQQIKCLSHSADYDMIFAPWMNFTFVLATLKILGLFRKPILVVAGSAYLVTGNNWLKRLKNKIVRYVYMKGIDKIIFVNKSVYEAAAWEDIQGNTDYLRAWGVDVNFFKSFSEAQPEPPRADYLCSISGSRRDFGVLIKALKNVDFPLEIVSNGPGTIAPEVVNSLPSNVRIDDSILPGMTSTAALRKIVYHSKAVAIPMFTCPHGEANGDKVMMEALAMGKPVIITKDRFLPFDVEEEGVGIKVEVGDVAGWERAINYLLENPEETEAMGRRALKLVEERYNYRLFTEEIIDRIEATNTLQGSMSVSNVN